MSIEASVVDTGYRQMYFMPYMMMMAVGYEKESGTGYEKGTMIISGVNADGNPSEDWQLYDAAGNPTSKGPRLQAHVWTHEVNPFFVVIFTDWD